MSSIRRKTIPGKTIKRGLPSELGRKVEAFAKQEKSTPSAVMRKALQEFVAGIKRAKKATKSKQRS